MNSVQQIPLKLLLYPQLLNNATATSEVLDTVGIWQGAARLRVGVIIGATPDVDFTSLYLQESDDNASDYTTIPNTRYGTDSGTLPVHGSDGKTVVGWNIDLQSRKRYIKIVAVVGGTTGTTGVYLCATAEIDKVEDTFSPSNVAQGFAQLIYA